MNGYSSLPGGNVAPAAPPNPLAQGTLGPLGQALMMAKLRQNPALLRAMNPFGRAPQ